VVAVQRDTQSLVEEKTTALSAATQQANEFSAKATLLEAALSREKESTQDAFAKQEEAEARTAQLEAQLRKANWHNSMSDNRSWSNSYEKHKNAQTALRERCRM